MAILSYNGVVLPMSNITEFNQEVMYDEESGTDWYCTKYTIGVQTLLSLNYLSVIAPFLSAAGLVNPADIMASLREDLMRPRKQLSVKFNGVELIPQPQKGLKGVVDAQNGPKPQSCRIIELNNTTFILVYVVVANYWENISPRGSIPATSFNQKGNPVLSNKWSETIVTNECDYSIRTRTGRYIIRSDNVNGFIADQFRRDMAIVGVPPGFLRHKAQYTVSPDGLGLKYEIVDREVFRQPPAPAFKAQGMYNESLGMMTAVVTATVRVRLEGNKDTAQETLVRAAVQMCSAKLKTRGSNIFGKGKSFPIIKDAVLNVDFYNNVVEMTAVCYGPREGLRIQGFNLFAQQAEPGACTPPRDDPTYTPPYRDYGTANLLLQAAAYYDPSLANVVLQPESPLNTGANLFTRTGAGGANLSEGLDVGQAGVIKE